MVEQEEEGSQANAVFGLTGGIACGKSTVASLLRAQGAVVIDADQIAREVVVPGSEGLRALCAHFGDAILLPDGQLDRDGLAAIVFADAAEREVLNGILHPRIAQRAGTAIAAALLGTARPILYEAALLVETGTHTHFAGLVVVSAPREVQRRRLMERDGLSQEAADARIDAQMPVEDKVALADWVIHNAGSLEDLAAQVEALLPALRQRS